MSYLTSHVNMRAFLLALIGFSGFAIGDAAYKWLASDAAVMVNAMIGAGVAVSFALLYGLVTGKFLAFLHVKKRGLFLLRGAVVACEFLLFIYSYSHLPLTTSYAVIFCAPCLTVLLAPLMTKEPFQKTEIIAAGIGFLGVLLAFPPKAEGVELWAFLAALAAAVFVALMNIMANLIGDQENSGYAFSIYTIGTTFLMALALVLINGDPLPALNVPIAGAYLIAALSGLVGVICVSKAFAVGKAGFVASTHYVQIFWGVVLGYLLFSDIPSWQVVAGLVLIVGSGLYLVRHGVKV